MTTTGRAQEFSFTHPAETHSIDFGGEVAEYWLEGGYEVYYLEHQAHVAQDSLRITAGSIILLRELRRDENNLQKVIVYAEDDVLVSLPITPEGDQGTQEIHDATWLGRLFTTAEVRFPDNLKSRATFGPPAIFVRAGQAIAAGGSGVMPVQYQESSAAPQILISPLTGETQELAPPPLEELKARRPQTESASSPNEPLSLPAEDALPRPGQTQVEFFARDSLMDLNLRVQTNPNNPSERVFLGTGGVRVSVTSPEIANSRALRDDGGKSVVVLADNVVAWETAFPNGEARWELYLEGNIVFSKGSRVIFADQMYFDATANRGTILNADMLTPVNQYKGLVRLKAKVIEQLNENELQAIGAAFTSSRMGVPRYWLQSDRIDITRRPTTQIDANGKALFDPVTGQLETADDYYAEAAGNYLYVSDRPVFFWPRFRTNLNDPSIYLDQFKLGNDRVFGYQFRTAWDLHQILGFGNRPDRSRWIGNIDYLSKRGLGFGTELDYARQSLFGLPGTAEGFYRGWSIRDDGLDNLGRGRTALTPEETFRGNSLLRHRNRFEPGYSLRAEFGYLSDRNFLEQFYERRWDTDKDYTTGLWLERNIGTQSFNVVADYQLNEFFTQTSWLPRLDHFLLGQSLLGDRLVWHGHSQIGYGRFRPATAPLDPADLAPWDLTAWEASAATGIRAGTRQEVDMPFNLGPMKVVPYVLGDATYWQQDLTQNDLLRGYGQVGIKTSLPIWRVDPTIQSTLWNLNGLAHKISFESEFLYADASKDLNSLPLYDPLDDDAQEAFRHRFVFNTFGIPPGGDVPLKYDERYFALRSGMQSWITAPSNEIADDLSVFRFGVNQRWQTKRGGPGNERIVDWISMNTQVSLFPNATENNFGSDWGLFNYDFEWHVGDRFSLVSDGFADFFSQGLRTASVGMHVGRPEAGNFYLGYRTIEGPISSNIINGSVVYRMSDRWGVRANTSVDFGQTGTIGNALSVIYIGESFLWRVGMNYDASRDNLGFVFGIEPRFLNQPRMFRPGNVSIPPAGARYLE